MKFGIFSNGQRHRADIAQSWDDDIHEIVTAEKVGLEEAWISEHTGLPYLTDAVPAAELLIGKAAALTERIKLGPAVRRIALYPPQMVAIEGAVCDHLTRGRYMMGLGVGGPVANHEHWGLSFADAHERSAEAIDLIVRCWEETAPFDYEGRFYRGKNISIYPKPMQRPVPVAVATTRGLLLDLAAERGLRLLTSQFARGSTTGEVAALFDQECFARTGVVRRRDVTAVRGVYVHDTDAKAYAEVEASWNEHLAYNKKYFAPVFNEYIPKGGTLDDVTFGRLIEEGMLFVGSPQTVLQSIKRFYNDVGGFGTFLMVAGKDWGTKEQRDRMYHLFAEAVVPKLRDLDNGLDESGRVPRSVRPQPAAVTRIGTSVALG